MKTIKIIVISLLGLVVVVFIGALIFIKTLDVNKYLPQITQQISHAINRPVTIDHLDLGLSLTRGLSLGLKDLTIKDDVNFSSKDFLSIKEASLGLDLMPLLLQRQVHITKVVISYPHIAIIRSSEGKINAQTMVPEQPVVASSGASSPANPPAESQANSVTLPEVSIKSILIEHGDVSFEDKNAQMPLHVGINDIDAQINNFSLTEAFDFVVHVNAWGKSQKNIDVTGNCALDLSNNAAHITHLKITSDLSQWDWAQVKTITPMLANLPVWPQEIKGKFLTEIPELKASAKGLDKLSLNATLSDGYVKLKELLNPIKDINIQVDSDLTNANLKSLKAIAGAGEINAQGHVQGLLAPAPTYDFQFEVKGVNIDELLDESAWPAVLKGAATGQLSGSGESFQPDAMMKALKADGSFSLANAKIEKLNILQTILGKLSMIPGLADQVEAALSSTIKDKLNSDTTILDKAEARIKVADKVIAIESADIESKVFSINAQGTVGLDMITAIDLKFYLASDLSAALIKSAKPLSGLLDDQQRLYIPGKITGKVPSVGYQPDMSYISKKAITAEGADQLNKQLNKVFKKNPEVGNLLNGLLGGQKQDNSTTNSETQSNTEQQQNQQGDSTKKLINNVFDKFLR
jgi:hypothetical protein